MKKDILKAETDNSITVKLSKAQQELIKKMKDGVICHHIQGLNARCFLEITHKSVNWATIYKLEELGLVQRNDNAIVLTEKGIELELKQKT